MYLHQSIILLLPSIDASLPSVLSSAQKYLYVISQLKQIYVQKSTFMSSKKASCSHIKFKQIQTVFILAFLMIPMNSIGGATKIHTGALCETMSTFCQHLGQCRASTATNCTSLYCPVHWLSTGINGTRQYNTSIGPILLFAWLWLLILRTFKKIAYDFEPSGIVRI